MATDIKYGETRELVFVPVDDGVAQSGETTEVLIRRLSDGYSWTGSAFASGDNWLAMSEIGTTGQYIYSLTFPVVDTDIQALYRVALLEIFGSEDIYVRDIPEMTEITTEINENEVKLDTLISRLGVPSTNLYSEMIDRFDNIDVDIQAVYDAVILIQNNVSTVLTGPKMLVRPDAGTKPYRYLVLNYDNVGNMEDFNADPTLTGTYVSGGGAYFAGTMTHDGTGQYHFDVDVAFDDTLGSIQVKLDAVIAITLAPRVMVIASEVSDYDDELAEIKADTEQIISDIATHDAHLTAVEVALTAEINENEALITTMLESYRAHLVLEPIVPLNSGYGQMDNNGIDLPIGSSEIPLQPGQVDFFREKGFALIDDASPENIEIDGFNDVNLVLVGTTSFVHPDGAIIIELSGMPFRVYIEKQDGLPFQQADSAPTFEVYNEFGLESSGVMNWNAVKNCYEADLSYLSIDVIGTRRLEVSVVEDTLTKVITGFFELLARPVSEKLFNETLLGGQPPNTFVFDHDGWKDESNIYYPWTDDMAGSLKDDTGKPATGILIRAFLKGTDGQWLLVNNPPYHDYSNIFGHYHGALEAGTYLFTFYKDNHKWQEVEREIG